MRDGRKETEEKKQRRKNCDNKERQRRLNEEGERERKTLMVEMEGRYRGRETKEKQRTG
jgi:hypothetical protein